MIYRALASAFLIAGVGLGALGLSGCAATREVFGKEARKTTVDIPYDGDTVPTTVISYSNENDSAMGVSELSNQNYRAAKASFEAAVQKDGKDAESYFGLGVACEMLKEYPAALRAYEQANRLAPTDVRSRAVARVLDKDKSLRRN